MNFLVSINCITYNHEKYIRDAIEGFLMQKTNFDFEILIGEDCSTDYTLEIVKGYVDRFPEKIKLITSDVNVGWRKNSERVLANSQGKYIALCEGDDFWTDPHKLQKQVDYMESHAECSFCFHAASIVDASGKQTNRRFRSYEKSGICLTGDVIEGGGEFCPTASILFPKKLVENLPTFYQNAHVGDYPLQMWLAIQGYGYYFDEDMASYRSGATGSWTSQLNSGADAIEKNINIMKSDIKLLHEFDEYTNQMYTEAVKRTITKKEFKILLLQSKIKEARKGKYKRYYNQLNSIQKGKLFFNYFFPKLYSKIVYIKRTLN